MISRFFHVIAKHLLQLHAPMKFVRDHRVPNIVQVLPIFRIDEAIPLVFSLILLRTVFFRLGCTVLEAFIVISICACQETQEVVYGHMASFDNASRVDYRWLSKHLLRYRCEKAIFCIKKYTAWGELWTDLA